MTEHMIGVNTIDLTGKTFGKLTVIEYAGNNKHSNARWKCKCECGNVTTVNATELKNGDTKSCGCLHTKHGMSHTRIYQCWKNILDRCNNPENDSYQYYGARGVSYDPMWDDFENFLDDMGSEYSEFLEIDRIDNNKGYCKENCRWSTKSVQMHNRRKFENRSSKFVGVCYIKDCEKFRVSISSQGKRINLGRFINEIDAAIAYDNASEEIYGDRPNNTVRAE